MARHDQLRPGAALLSLPRADGHAQELRRALRAGHRRAGPGRPLSGEVFVFTGRRRTHIKLLVWDRSGFVLYYKRLEEGTFELPSSDEAGPLTWQQLVLMLEGVSLESARYRKRYALSAPLKLVG